MQIPKTVTLPFGYKIRVQQLNKDGWWKQYRIRKPPLATWYAQKRRIILSKDAPMKCRRADFIHEMGHAFQDWQSDMQWSRKVDLKG